MTLETLYFLAGILASLAVVVSLVFVGFQLRHAANQQRIATAAGYYDFFRDHMKAFEDPVLVEIFYRGMEGGWEALEPHERARLSVLYTMVTRGYQVMHYQARMGVFEPDFWKYTQNHFRDNLISKFYLDYWRIRRHHFPPDFQAMVDEMIELGPTAALMPLHGDGSLAEEPAAAPVS